MEVDGDVGKLTEELCSLGTVDHEVLIRQFQQILGQELSVESCTFFLDMNNWNLPAALGSYYDLGGSTYNGVGPPPELVRTELPQMSFERDVTIGEGESVPPSTRFIKTWRVRNPGNSAWPQGILLKHIEGQLLSNQNSVSVPALKGGESGDVSLEMVSPSHRGIYQSRWQMTTAEGIPFGEAIWCIIVVDDMGLLGLTQQFASTGCEVFGKNHSGPVDHETKSPGHNPFGAGMSFHGQQQTTGWNPNVNSTSGRVGISTISAISQSPPLSPASSRRMVGLATPPRAVAQSSRDSDSDRMTRSDIVLFSKRHGTQTSSASTPNSGLDISLMAHRGSPAPYNISLCDVDPPASPNGSSALYEAVAAALPPWHQMNSTAPVTIPQSMSEGLFPHVPPCTPSTPPTINRCQDSQTAHSEGGDNQDMQT